MPVLEYSTDRSNDRIWGLTLTTWVQIVCVTVLMCAMFRFNLARLWGKTNPFNGQDINWQHSIFVPLIGIWYLFLHREELLKAAGATPKRELSIRIIALLGLVVFAIVGGVLLSDGSFDLSMVLLAGLAVGMLIPAIIPTAKALGGVLLAEGLIIFAFGIYPGQNDYIKDLGMVITLFGVVTLGWAVMKVAWFPIAFLVVALPWPELVYARLAWPLQQLAASVAVGTLRMFNVDAKNYGTRIVMAGAHGELRMLNVAEACAGLKSVMTFLMVGGTVAFLSSRSLWEKVVITLSGIPIAIFCNVLRVSGQGLLDFYWSHEVSEGFAHGFVGLIMLVPGFFLILMVGWIIDKLFIEEVDRAKLARAAAGRGKRIIVEVPRRSEVGADGTFETNDSTAAPDAPASKTVVPVIPQVTAPVAEIRAVQPVIAPAVAAVMPAPAPTKVAPPTPVVPAAPIAKPIAKSATPPAPSTLKPTSKERPATASPVTPPSTLKPSSKPASERAAGITPPPSGLKPSTLKPSAKPATPLPPSTLKPSTLKPSAARTSGTNQAGVRPPAQSPSLAPPARKPPAAPGTPPRSGQADGESK